MLVSTLDEYSRLLCSLFSPFYTRLLRPDIGAQEPDTTVDYYYYYYSGGAYYYVQPADDDQE